MSGPELPVYALAAAARRIADVRSSVGEKAVRLAYHAAVPVVVDAELLNLLRVNFFLDPPDALGYEAEAALLLSPLFREVGDGLYEIEPGPRNLLLSGLQQEYGDSRVRRVAALLEQYTDASVSWRALPELEMAQRLTAVSFLDPSAAREWLDGASSGAELGAGLDREWYVAMEHRIGDQRAVPSVDEEIRRVLNRLDPTRPVEDRLALIRDLDALVRLPAATVDLVVHALCRFMEAWDALSPGPSKRVTQDVQAALTLIGTIRHGIVRLYHVALTGADLIGLDFSGAVFESATLTELRASGIDLTGAHLSNVVLTDAVLDGARLDHATLAFQSLRRVSLRGVSAEATEIGARSVEDVTATDVNGAPVAVTRLARPEDEAYPEHADDGTVQAEEPTPPEGGLPAATRKVKVTDVLEPMLGRARQAEESGDWERARNEYQRATDLTDGQDPVPLSGLARAFTQLGLLSDAIRCYQRAIALYEERTDLALQPEQAGALLGLGDIWLKVDRAADALRYFDGAAAIYVGLGDRIGQGRVLLSRGMALESLGNARLAERRYRDAIAIFRDAGERLGEASALSGLANVLVAQSKLGEAVESAKRGAEVYRALGDQGAGAALLQRIARVCAATGADMAAVELYARAHQAYYESLSPDHPDAQGVAHELAVELTKVGDRRLGEGDYSNAQVNYEAAIGYDPGLAAAHSGRGAVLLRAGRYPESKDAFQEALSLDPDDAHALRGLGEAMQRAGQFYGALARVLGARKDRVGVGFQVAPGIMVTALHVLGESTQAGERVRVESPTGEWAYSARLSRVDVANDIAVVEIETTGPDGIPGLPGRPSWLTLFAPAHLVPGGDAVRVLNPLTPGGFGRWVGRGSFGKGSTGLLEGSSGLVVPNMSGTPVVRERDGAVIGMVVASGFNESLGRSQLRVARAEDIVKLLDGIADVTLER